MLKRLLAYVGRDCVRESIGRMFQRIGKGAWNGSWGRGNLCGRERHSFIYGCSTLRCAATEGAAFSTSLLITHQCTHLAKPSARCKCNTFECNLRGTMSKIVTCILRDQPRFVQPLYSLIVRILFASWASFPSPLRMTCGSVT